MVQKLNFKLEQDYPLGPHPINSAVKTSHDIENNLNTVLNFPLVYSDN